MDNLLEFDWGKELVWVKNKDYCGKILIFEKERKTIPFHFHREISKSWFVNAGKFLVSWIDTTDGKAYSKELPEGSVFHIPKLTPVKLESLVKNSAMAESSTGHVEDDYYKLG